MSTLSPVCPSRLSVSPLRAERARARAPLSFLLWLQSNAVLGALDSLAASRDLVSPRGALSVACSAEGARGHGVAGYGFCRGLSSAAAPIRGDKGDFRGCDVLFGAVTVRNSGCRIEEGYGF